LGQADHPSKEAHQLLYKIHNLGRRRNYSEFINEFHSNKGDENNFEKWLCQ
jgi:hypothetical protein